MSALRKQVDDCTVEDFVTYFAAGEVIGCGIQVYDTFEYADACPQNSDAVIYCTLAQVSDTVWEMECWRDDRTDPEPVQFGAADEAAAKAEALSLFQDWYYRHRQGAEEYNSNLLEQRRLREAEDE